jgi:ribosome biogenesis GTPase
MELKNLGFDSWFQEELKQLPQSDHSIARVTAVDRDRYLVRGEMGEVPAELAGRVMFSAESSMDLPTVGDWALVQYQNADTLAIIQDLLPRRSILRRKAAGKKVDYQLIAANIDVAFIVQACDSDFSLPRLDRYLVVIREGHIEPMILLSKSDLVDEESLGQMIGGIERAGISCGVIALSNETGHGLDRVKSMLERGRTYCLLGSSGVGKTTLLNHLIGHEEFETRSVREKDGKGRHTTARRQLIVLDNGAMVIDNPGMRELGVIGVDTGIDESFAEIRELSMGCRFRDCTHTNEAGCAILKAIENGELSEERYRSYLKLLKESEYHQMSYVEKRKKDREFGQFIKSVMKHKKKNK